MNFTIGLLIGAFLTVAISLSLSRLKKTFRKKPVSANIPSYLDGVFLISFDEWKQRNGFS